MCVCVCVCVCVCTSYKYFLSIYEIPKSGLIN